MYKTIRTLSRHSPLIRRLSSRYFYQFASRMDTNGDIVVMNFGYASLDPNARPVSLRAEDEFNRYCLQLYHHVASAIDLRGLDVLEVGSGRGGGAAYVKQYLSPRSMTGIELSKNAVAFCQRHHNGHNELRFQQGDAEDLPFPDESFDAVLNVESSHCYGDMTRFLRGVHRVLRPGGHLLWTDPRPPHKVSQVYEEFRQCGFEVVKDEIITRNVLEAMARQQERNATLVERIVPWFARRGFNHFAGVDGSYIHELFLSGELEYLHVVLRKR